MSTALSAASPVYSRKNPFPARLLVNRLLNRPGSEKETRHFEFSIEESGLDYEVGDSLGVFPENDVELVGEILGALGLGGDEPVDAPDGSVVPIAEALRRHYVITDPSRQLLQACAEKDSSAQFLTEMLNTDYRTELDKYLWGRGVIDTLVEFDQAKFQADEFVKVLRKLQPRLYSIASSRKAVGHSVHLTVAVVRYESHGRIRKGVCSNFLARSEPESGIPVPVFVHTAKHFRVPENPACDAIMVGPGTGIAPFRAFLQERAATGATGRNWLFFGEQHASTDFFYREEFEASLRNGCLTRLDTAFSRDQSHKIYVQHRLDENGAQIFSWIEGGAVFYVCGDANRMAKDVDASLHDIVVKHGGKTPEQAIEYVKQLKHEKRYRRDVY